MRFNLNRFTQALFGRNDITFAKTEFGMYAAKSASLRSGDLSRQVGAAIFSVDGELVTRGCNEVPKAFGGTYWDQEEPDYRDFEMGFDPNDELKKQLLIDLFERLHNEELLSDKAKAFGTALNLVNFVTRRASPDNEGEHDGCLVGADVMDLTEFGRVVHAEMGAICDAARLGRSVKGCTMFCTTFPCHNCTKHVLASGIRRVVFMEPYPKSRAKDLHQNELEIENTSTARVEFIPFLGISPFRYRDIFQKAKRKDEFGKATKWAAGEARPVVDVIDVTYLEAEHVVFGTLLSLEDASKAEP